MVDLLVNIDVDDLDEAVAFYTQGLGLRVGRRFGGTVVELLGASSRIYLLRKRAGSAPYDGASATRSYARHWTPLHFDVVVPELDAALAQALAAGAVQEGDIGEHAWGRIALLSDPFGHGFCLLAFSEQGYDALTGGAGPASKRILVVAHAPSDNTRRMLGALMRGAGHPDAPGVSVRHLAPLEARPEDVRGADAIVLLTPENLGYMSGAMKDFFDRIYYPCLDRTDNLPYALVIRGRHDGTGTRRGVQTILKGLKWKAVEAPLMCVGELEAAHVDACEELGAKLAVGLEMGIF